MVSYSFLESGKAVAKPYQRRIKAHSKAWKSVREYFFRKLDRIFSGQRARLSYPAIN